MGVKEVLYRTKHLGWGSDTHLYRTGAEFGAAFPVRLQSSGPRVIKQNRGNDGLGVWKVEQIATHTGAADTVRVLHAGMTNFAPVPSECARLRAREVIHVGSDAEARASCGGGSPFWPRRILKLLIE